MNLPNPRNPTLEPRLSSVWELYNEKAKIRDKALLKDWDSSINSLLLFAAIFAAVLTALCVESRRLLEPDPLESIQKTLFYIALGSNDQSLLPPPPGAPFEPPYWAVVVNGLFFTSLTTSILAAVGAVTCLQWVGEYDAGLEAASTPQMRALRWHYRYRAIDEWYMRHMIASLPILLYISVAFFLTGLTVWFYHLQYRLAVIPLTGLLIWTTGYAITTIMAAFFPSAPYRTALSKGLFRVIFLAAFYVWKYAQTILILYRPLLTFLRHFFDRGKYPWNEYRNQFILEKIDFSRQMKSRLLEDYPWMPVGRDSWQSMHSHVWEQGRIARDETLHLSTLAWLANSIDLSEHSIPNFRLLLEELNNIDENKLRQWPAYNYDAPWSHIFNMVLTPSTQAEGLNLALHPEKILPTLAQLLQKMSLHPTLFERMIEDLDNNLLISFMHHMASDPPRTLDVAESRLTSVTFLLSSKKWEEMDRTEQPVMHLCKVILDCLDKLQTGSSAHNISTAWIFTLCPIDETQCDPETTISWPNPELIRFIPDAFENKDLREHAIEHYLHFADSIFSDAEPVTDTEQNWRWNMKAETTPETQLVVVTILARHLLRIFFLLNNPLEPEGSQELFNRLLKDKRITHPTLRLLMSAFGGYQQVIDIAPEGDDIWDDRVWRYALRVWYDFHTHFVVSTGKDTPTPGFLELSASILRESPRSNDHESFDVLRVAASAFGKLSAESASRLKLWVSALESIRESDVRIIRQFSSKTVGLDPDEWLQLFTHFHSSEVSRKSSPVTSAMLLTLKSSLQSDLLRIRWQQAAEAVAQTQAVPSGRSTTMARLLGVVNEYWRRERPYRHVPTTFASGMLMLIRNVLRYDQSDASSSFERPRACVSAVDELALAYASGSQRHPHYTRLFSEIADALVPMCKRFTVHPGGGPSSVATSGPLNDALSWPVNLQAACDHASHAGGIKRTDTAESTSLAVETTTRVSEGAEEMQNISHDRSVRIALFRRSLIRRFNDSNV